MERSSFVLVFGGSPFVRVLDFFLTYEGFDYSIAQIAEETETKWESVNKAIKILIKKGVVKRTRKVGKAWLYILNKESRLTNLILEIDMKISDFFVSQELEKQKLRVAVRLIK